MIFARTVVEKLVEGFLAARFCDTLDFLLGFKFGEIAINRAFADVFARQSLSDFFGRKGLVGVFSEKIEKCRALFGIVCHIA